MASDISSVLNSKLRMTGMVSGLDTDSMIKQLMKAETMKVDKAKQNKQLLEWSRDAYRDVSSLVRSIKDTYFDVLKPDSNMVSKNTYKAFTISSTDSNTVTATADYTALIGTHKIKATSLATAANTISSAGVTKGIISNNDITDFDFTTARQLTISLNGDIKEINISGDFAALAATNGTTAIAELKSAVQSAVDASFGAGKIAIGNNGDKLTFDAANSRMYIFSGSDELTDATSKLQITPGVSNRLNLNSTLELTNLSKSLTGTLEFKVNGVDFKFDAAKNTMNDVISAVNSSTAGAALKYSEVTDTFTLTSKDTGAGEAIKIENISGDLFGVNSAINITDSSISNGTDAVFDLDGVTGIVRSSNKFTIDGVTYNLTAKDIEATITVKQDVDTVYNKIKKFIDTYNDVIGALNDKLTETRDRNYLPLTDDQKSAMQDTDIQKWEDKAKKGLLHNDTIIGGIVNSLRSAMYDSIKDAGGSLLSIGITTGSYADKGKLVIDEYKLKDAIENTPETVMNVFAKESSIDYAVDLTDEQVQTRYTENGIVARMSDIIQNAIRTSTDKDNHKGSLVEKAGVYGDLNDVTSILGKEISDSDDNISTLISKLSDKQDSYYQKFAAMETALNKMNSQSAWLSQQFGSSQ